MSAWDLRYLSLLFSRDLILFELNEAHDKHTPTMLLEPLLSSPSYIHKSPHFCLRLRSYWPSVTRLRSHTGWRLGYGNPRVKCVLWVKLSWLRSLASLEPLRTL